LKKKKKKILTTQVVVRLKDDEMVRLVKIKDKRKCSASSVMRAAFMSYDENS